MVSHLINGQDATADHFGLRGDKIGEDEPRAVTQHQTVRHIEGLDGQTIRGGREGERLCD